MLCIHLNGWSCPNFWLVLEFFLNHKCSFAPISLPMWCHLRAKTRLSSGTRFNAKKNSYKKGIINQTLYFTCTERFQPFLLWDNSATHPAIVMPFCLLSHLFVFCLASLCPLQLWHIWHHIVLVIGGHLIVRVFSQCCRVFTLQYHAPWHSCCCVFVLYR